MPIVAKSDCDSEVIERGDMHVRRRHLSAEASEDGDPDLGCSLYELPPGARSWPYHYHEGNAEAMYVLHGTGSIRLDDEHLSIESGDYIPFPVGEAGAHRVHNDSSEPLRYLAFSTMNDPDITVYPTSGKIGVFAGSPPGGREERTEHGFYRRVDAVDYWDGEVK